MATPKNTRRAMSGTILVTGATGHLGANLVRRLLDDGHSVRALVHPDHDATALDGLTLKRVPGDLRDPDAVDRAVEGATHIFHVGAMVSTITGTRAHRRQIWETNVLGTRHILTSARRHGIVRTVVTGSMSAVGADPDDAHIPSTEDTPVFPFRAMMPYERSKQGVEHEVLKAALDGQDVAIATSCAIIGPWDFLPSRLGRTFCDCANGKLHATVAGGFEFVRAADLVEGHIRVMEQGRRGQRYTFSTEYKTIEELLDIFSDVSGRPVPKRRLPAPLMRAFSEIASPILSRIAPNFPQRLTPGAIQKLQMRRRADISKAREELGYEPTSIRAAIAEQYAFFWARGAITHANARAPEIPTSFKSVASARSAA